jgi:hypothetical protein
VSRPHAREGVAGTVTVTLEDHGQDFLEWDIDLETMHVIECRPYQGWVWKDTIVSNAVLRRGDRLLIKPRHSKHFTRLRYPIAEVGQVVPKHQLWSQA